MASAKQLLWDPLSEVVVICMLGSTPENLSLPSGGMLPWNAKGHLMIQTNNVYKLFSFNCKKYKLLDLHSEKSLQANYQWPSCWMYPYSQVFVTSIAFCIPAVCQKTSIFCKHYLLAMEKTDTDCQIFHWHYVSSENSKLSTASSLQKCRQCLH